MASFTLDPPPVTSPSTGTFSPGRTWTTSPTDELAHRHVDGPAVADEVGLGRHDPDERLERPGGPHHRAHLDVVAEEHDVDQGRELPEEAHARREPEDHRGRIDVGDRDGEGDQGHHADAAGPDLRREPGEERPSAVEVDHGREEEDRVRLPRERELDPDELLHLGGQGQDRDREDQRDDEPAPVVGEHPVVVAVAWAAWRGRSASGMHGRGRLLRHGVGRSVRARDVRDRPS